MMTNNYNATIRRRPTTKRALLVGISYRNWGGQEWGRLPTSIPNVKKFKDFLQGHRGYADAEITVMTDEDGVEERLQPTRANLKHQIEALRRGVKPGDRLIFYFTGHSSQSICRSGSEEDGLDETLVPLDGLEIKDNDLHEWLVKDLPKRSALTAIFDCCNSGTLLDLPHFKCNNVYRPWVNKGIRSSRSLCNYNVRKNCRGSFFGSSIGSGDQFPSLTQVVRAMESRQARAPLSDEATGKHLGGRCASPERMFECDGWCRKRMQTIGALPHADVISISSSGDGQISYDASTRDGGSLSMTTFLIDILTKDPQLTYSQLMTSLNHKVYSFTRGMHSVVRQQRRDRREADRKNPSFKNAVAPEEDKGEMDNFQDLQLGSITPLDMDRIFML
ncbi:caspase domain-containing protein [Thelephora terrestris]|uniref:Caspase domain-containing protein n=1 Tax=Thelephora terrestris TaxID=56493 RepID=A0A9P6HHX5_9AGAM|nr:caspase domain-containing protein [Thelephora terrestris]